MTLTSKIYNLGLRTLRGISPLFSRGDSKVAEGIRGRVQAGETLLSWGREERDRSLPLIWSHAPSVGEGLQARAVLQALQGVRPEMQSVFTWFSPSAVKLGKSMPVNVSAYFPWDVQPEMTELLEVLNPQTISFTKTEVWPGLTRAAVAQGIPVTLVAATLPAAAGRLRSPARQLLRPTFESLSVVCAISGEDGDRFLQLGVPSSRIEITGDPGVDSAWQRLREADPNSPHLTPFFSEPAPTVVAGSTWQEDEDVLLPALGELRTSVGAFRFVIAPHEPTEAHLGHLEARLRTAGFRSIRLSEVESTQSIGDADAVVVNRVGVLAHLYRIGVAAYVGGGFGSDGLHSVLEPSAAGIPSLIGPHHANSLSAMELVRRGGCRIVRNSREVVDTLGDWLGDHPRREEAGVLASEYIEVHRGASLRSARVLDKFVPASYGAVK